MKTFVVMAGKKNGVFSIVLGYVDAAGKREAKKLARQKFPEISYIMVEEKIM